jgi:hypothetical protein
MFIRVETSNRLLPFWKSISYINLSNILRMDVEKKHINFHTVFHPKYSAYRINFQSEQEAQQFAEKVFARLPGRVPRLTVEPPSYAQKRFSQHYDEASPDVLAIAAMQEWEKEKQLK